MPPWIPWIPWIPPWIPSIPWIPPWIPSIPWIPPWIPSSCDTPGITSVTPAISLAWAISGTTSAACCIGIKCWTGTACW